MSVRRDDPALAGGDALAEVLAAGGPELARSLDRTEARLAEIADGHGSKLGRHSGGTLAAGGKRLRPMLVFTCAPSGKRAQDLVRAAAAVELLHMATLVHDDVLDRAPLRRGKPTVFAAAGREAATATGDLLFSRAFSELSLVGDEDAVRTLSRASSALARGELMQRADAWSDSVTAERYLERCALKTGALFEAACCLGAVFGGAPEPAAAALAEFGSRIGLAFQIFDDVLDVAGPPERTGKPRGTDLLDGTVTLPLILARRRDGYLRALDLRAVVSDGAQAEALSDRIARTGALGEAREAALGHVAEAKAALANVELPPQRRRVLDRVADGVVERYA